MAPSHVRFGSFEVFFHRRQHDHVRTLADYVLRAHYPELLTAEKPYLSLLAEVVYRTAELVARWQAVGFCHGVMNTDNMSILGLTLDYGPYGFLDGFDWNHVCNHSDQGGRYAYNMQPKVAHWNLYCLAQALLPLLEMEDAEAALARFEPAFDSAYAMLMRAKLGLQSAEDDDAQLLADLLGLMNRSHTDFSIFFRSLATFDAASGANDVPKNAPRNAHLRDQFTEREAFDHWSDAYRARLAREASVDHERRARMNLTNPAYVLRNWMAEEAIALARDERDFTRVEAIRRLLSTPFEEQSGMQRYAAAPPDWASRISVSCSS